VAAFAELPDERLVVVGAGPLGKVLRTTAPGNVTFAGAVDDAALRWLYGASVGLIAPSYEDFGLTPLEAACFGVPAAVLRWGGFLDTTVEGSTGLFFDEPSPAAIGDAVRAVRRTAWDRAALVDHGRSYGADRFAARMRTIVDEVG
jgi:glycosyltransferase involved in cell wall biosynthesis